MHYTLNKNRLGQQDGSIMVTALMFMSILSIIGIYANNVATTEIQMTTNVQTNQMAFFDADAGVQRTLAMIREQLNDNIQIEDIDLNDSEYQAPTGFTFEVTKIGTWDEADPVYFFESTGFGPNKPNGASFTIEVAFTRSTQIHPAFNIGILSDGDITLNGEPNVVGNIHANGNVEQKSGDGSITGYVSAVGTAVVDATVSGGVSSGVDPIEVPYISSEQFDEWRAMADIREDGPYTFSSTGNLNGQIIFVDGDLTIPNGNIVINATFIATGDITFRGQSIVESPGGPIGVAVISGGDILFNGSGHSEGVFWCNGSFTRNGSNNITGSIVSGLYEVTFNGGFTFEHEGNINNDHLPTIKLVSLDSWADQGLLMLP